MPAELWRQIIQIGKETVAGTPVAATRKMYLRDLAINNPRETRYKRFMVGRRDNQLAATQGPNVPEGTATADVSADELMEWLEITLGAPTTTTPGGATAARQHVYKPTNSPSTATIEHMDGANNNQLAGARGNTLEFTGSVDGELTCNVGLFAQGFTDSFGSLTAALTDRVPTFLEGWQTNLFIDDLGDTPGTTAVTGALVNWRVMLDGQLGRIYTAANTQNATGVNLGEFNIEGHITLLATAAGTATELTNWLANTSRLIRIQHIGPADGIETGFERTVNIDVPVAFNAPDRAQEAQGSRVYQFNFSYLYDPTLAAGLAVTLINDRAAAFA